MNVKDYWIDELKEIKEFIAIDDSQNTEITLLNDTVKNIISDQFIQTATERGIVRREKMLKISTFADDTLETRRFRVLTRGNEQLPYTYRVLESKLDQLCGKTEYTVELNSAQYILSIKIELTKKRMFNEISIMARKMVPGNIIINVELRYNQHSKIGNYTHRQLGQYTHIQVGEVAL